MLYNTIIINLNTGKIDPRFSDSVVSSGDEPWSVGQEAVIVDKGRGYECICHANIINIINNNVGLPTLIGTIG